MSRAFSARRRNPNGSTPSTISSHSERSTIRQRTSMPQSHMNSTSSRKCIPHISKLPRTSAKTPLSSLCIGRWHRNKIHAVLYGRAKEAVADGRDTSSAVLWVCPVCGFFMEGDPPELCPICATKRACLNDFKHASRKFSLAMVVACAPGAGNRLVLLAPAQRVPAIYPRWRHCLSPKSFCRQTRSRKAGLATVPYVY